MIFCGSDYSNESKVFHSKDIAITCDWIKFQKQKNVIRREHKMIKKYHCDLKFQAKISNCLFFQSQQSWAFEGAVEVVTEAGMRGFQGRSGKPPFCGSLNQKRILYGYKSWEPRSISGSISGKSHFSSSNSFEVGSVDSLCNFHGLYAHTTLSLLWQGNLAFYHEVLVFVRTLLTKPIYFSVSISMRNYV